MNWFSTAKGVAIGAITGICIGLTGFFLLRHAPGMGVAMFYLIPTCAGFAIALVTEKQHTIWAAAILAVLPSLLLLIAAKQEGLLCALLALPLLAFGTAIGVILGYFFRRYVSKSPRHTAILLGITPLLIFSGHQLEITSLEHARHEVISDQRLIYAPAGEVWGNLISLNTIGGEKLWLMHFGLPVPVRCSLERRGLGGKRTCYFETGTIQESITDWNPPYSMRLTIDRTNMPGRHWLGFDSAEYTLREVPNGTVLIRTTTISSHLYPAWYWGYFERLGVASEHQYILQAIADRSQKIN